jgi:hypothetical protein
MLAEKTPSGAAPNMHHLRLVYGELLGHQVPMTGQSAVGAGETKQAQDGTVGVHIDAFPEDAALLRWKNHEFLEIERTIAKQWRAELAAHDTQQIINALRGILPEEKLSDLERLKEFIDSFCSSRAPQVVELALDVLGVEETYKQFARVRWHREGRPPLDMFLPYTTHVFKVDLLFYLGIHRGFISGQRASNKADMAYLYYLPFSMVFVSGDRLHKRTVPLFLRDDQSYLPHDEFKAALREMDEYYDAFPDEIKELGVLQFVSWPPSDLDNTITSLWDKHMRPDWREIAKQKEAARNVPRDEEADRLTVEEMKARMEQARPVADQTVGLGGSGPDYVIIRRQVPVKKGKWRMVSKEVEEADQEDD